MAMEEWETAVATLEIDPGHKESNGTLSAEKPPSSLGEAGGGSTGGSGGVNGMTEARVEDGGGREGTGVSRAGAAAAVASATGSEGSIDPALIDALDNAREYLLKLERELTEFVQAEGGPQRLELPPRSSYQRLIAYRLASRFKLQKASAGVHQIQAGSASSMPTAATTYPKEHRPTVFLKTSDSCVPGILLATLAAASQQREETAALRAAADASAAAAVASTSLANSKGRSSVIKLMRRSPGDPRAPALGRGGSGGAGSEAQMKTVADRAKEYAAARARIFGTASPPAPAPAQGLAASTAAASSGVESSETAAAVTSGGADVAGGGVGGTTGAVSVGGGEGGQAVNVDASLGAGSPVEGVPDGGVRDTSGSVDGKGSSGQEGGEGSISSAGAGGGGGQ
ncbi:unnamed protein product, partial [Choristocarpus tenellus]